MKKVVVVVSLELFGSTGFTQALPVNDFWWMGHLKVTRNDKNVVTGSAVNSDRIMHLWFNKDR